MRFVILAALSVAVGTLAGCTQYASLAAGPAVVVAPEEDRPSGGLTVEAAEGTGRARPDGRRTSFVDLRARILVAERHQQAAALVGVSSVSWHGRDVPLWYGAAVGLGVERIPEKGFLEAVGQVRVGSGFTLDDQRIPIQPNPGETGDRTPRHIIRTRRVLTLGLQFDASPRFTRAPLLVTSIMLSLVTFDEVLPAPSPPPPAW